MLSASKTLNLFGMPFSPSLLFSRLLSIAIFQMREEKQKDKDENCNCVTGCFNNESREMHQHIIKNNIKVTFFDSLSGIPWL